MEKSKMGSFKLKAIKYCILNQSLHWKDPGGILLNCVDEYESHRIINEMHKGACGGHHYWKDTVYKILRVGYYWPTLFSNVFEKVRACKECQIFAGKQKLKPLPLKPIAVDGSFQQWGMDFIGEIHHPSSGQHKWILTTTDYFTKWIEAISVNATQQVVVKFLEENILSRFGCPRKIIVDNAQVFKSIELINFYHNHNIKWVHSTPYYPQGNGLAKSSNKSLVIIIKKMLFQNKKNWNSKLKYVMWVDRICTKKYIGTSPFQLVYGAKVVFLVQMGLVEKARIYRSKMKVAFDKRAKKT